MILPLNLTQVSAHICPSKYDPYIFLHWAQFRMQTPKKSKPDTESKRKKIFQQLIKFHNLLIYKLTKSRTNGLFIFGYLPDFLPITGLQMPKSINTMHRTTNKRRVAFPAIAVVLVYILISKFR